MKAAEWKRDGQTLHLLFQTSYEATLVRNKTEPVKLAAKKYGIEVTSVQVRESTASAPEEPTENSLAQKVRQVFRGEIIS